MRNGCRNSSRPAWPGVGCTGASPRVPRGGRKGPAAVPPSGPRLQGRHPRPGNGYVNPRRLRDVPDGPCQMRQADRQDGAAQAQRRRSQPVVSIQAQAPADAAQRERQARDTAAYADRDCPPRLISDRGGAHRGSACPCGSDAVSPRRRHVHAANRRHSVHVCLRCHLAAPAEPFDQQNGAKAPLHIASLVNSRYYPAYGAPGLSRPPGGARWGPRRVIPLFARSTGHRVKGRRRGRAPNLAAAWAREKKSRQPVAGVGGAR